MISPTIPGPNADRLLALFCDLCLLNTPARSETAVADLLQARLEAAGLLCRRDDAASAVGGSCGNLIATLPANAPGAPSIFLSAHMDTVEPTAGLRIVRDGDTLRSDGSTILGADCCAGLAPIVEAAVVLAESGLPHGDVHLLLTVCEEIGLLGAKALRLSEVGASMGFVFDSGPPVGSIVDSAPWQDCLQIEFRGRPAHAGAEPEAGISAIAVAARAVEKMQLGRIDEETTANIGSIRGDGPTNIVCAAVSMRGEARSRNAAKLEAQVIAMDRACREAASEFGAQVTVTVEHVYQGYVFSPADVVVRTAAEAAELVGLPVSYRGIGGGSDANVFNQAGVPTCVVGTGMRGVHTHEEHLEIADLNSAAQWAIAIALNAGRTI